MRDNPLKPLWGEMTVSLAFMHKCMYGSGDGYSKKNICNKN